MFKVENGIIFLTRGDSAVIDVDITMDGGGSYTMQAGDKLTLSVKKSTKAGNETLVHIDSETASIEIQPEDTKQLQPGNYSADIQLTTADGHIFTIYPDISGSYLNDGNWGNFKLAPEVTD